MRMFGRMDLESIVAIRRESIRVDRILRDRGGLWRLEFWDGAQKRLAVHQVDVLAKVVDKRRAKLPYVPDPLDQMEAAYELADLVVFLAILQDHERAEARPGS